MKFFTAFAFAGLVALVSAIPQAASNTETGVASSTSTTPLSPTASCIAACDNDITCQAACVGVPAPNAAMVNSTTECAMKCPQGSGTPSDTEAYGKCQQDCISSLFFSASATGSSGAEETGASASGTGASSAATTDSGSSASGSSGSSPSSGATSTASGSAASSSSTGAASIVQMGASTAGIVGILMAALAL